MKINIPHTAKLANLALTNGEEEKLEKQLGEIISYIKKLNEINTKNTKTTSQVTGLENVTREDKSSPCLSQEEALSNTKLQYNGLFKISAILEG